jgi:dipeptidyl-peptidase-4
VQNHSVTDYRQVPPTLGYTRYPVVGSANPKPSLHTIALATGQSSPVALPADAEYILPFFGWFPAGVAGSAPTSWAYYDTIYAERYTQTPSQNAAGYAATDLIAAADQLQARPLIIHGLNDTNVHLQNSINLIQALEALDKPFEFLPLPNLNHSYRGDGLVTALSSSVDYFVRLLGIR